jgi:acylphosphatase
MSNPLNSKAKETKNLFELHAIVHGMVQGVGFRATTQHFARQLGLTGSVRNLPNGKVEIYARGPKASLDKLLELLQNGIGQVDSITTNYTPCSTYEGEFQILF